MTARRSASPRVSVLIPAYNAGAYVGETIGSALSQTYADVEVIVVDDGSTDDTPGVLAGFGDRIVALHQANAGVAAARNTAFRAATGEVVALLDADDLWAPERVERCVEALVADPSLGFVTTDAVLVDEEGVATGGTYLDLVPFSAGDHRHEILRRNFLFVGALVWRDLFTGPTPFVERQPMGADDYELWLTLIADGAVPGLVAEPLASYRMRRDSITRRDDALERSKYCVLEQVLPRYWRDGYYGPSGQAFNIAWKALRRGDVVQSARFTGAAFRDPDRSPGSVCTDAFRSLGRRARTT